MVYVVQHYKSKVSNLSRVESGILNVIPVVQNSILFIRIELEKRAINETLNKRSHFFGGALKQ